MAKESPKGKKFDEANVKVVGRTVNKKTGERTLLEVPLSEMREQMQRAIPNGEEPLQVVETGFLPGVHIDPETGERNAMLIETDVVDHVSHSATRYSTSTSVGSTKEYRKQFDGIFNKNGNKADLN